MRLKRPNIQNGKRRDVTLLKSTLIARGAGEDRTIKMTMNGEKADLQLKYVQRHGVVELVHIHCLRHKESSDWRKTSGIPVEKFYKVSYKDGIYEIICKGCGRRWNSSGVTS